MWVTVEETLAMTGEEVPLETIAQAQTIIETVIGRTEVQVTDPFDKELLARATAYQAVYMYEDEDRVFKSVSAGQIMQFGNMITFRNTDVLSPFVAPLAAMAIRGLSWKRMRSVKTGSIFSTPAQPENWRTT